MNKQIENIKYQLADLPVIVNAFRSEAVQLRVIDRLLQVMMDSAVDSELFNKREKRFEDTSNLIALPKRPGATSMLSSLLLTDFFNLPRSICAIVDQCNQEFDTDIKASALSGVLLTLVKQDKLKRMRGTNDDRFEYIIR